MGSKKFTRSAIDWPKLLKLVPPEQMGKFYAFKAKNDGYLRRIAANPPQPPTIDWEGFKKVVHVKELVDKYKAAYDSFEVPYPPDKYTAEVDKQWHTLARDIKKYCAEMKAYIDKANNELTRIKSQPKFEDMTMEMFYDMYPNDALDPVKKPTFWPHTKDEQLGYVDPMTKVEH